MKALLAACLLASVAYAQIDVPPESTPYSPISASVKTTMPDGAIMSGGWTVGDGVQYLKCQDGIIHIWAIPGDHKLKYSGYWVHTEAVTFTDGSGKEITIQSFLGSGFVSEEAGFKVLGDPPPGPDPDDPPGPTPGGKYQIVYFLKAEELREMPAGQRYLLTSLKARKDLEALGHKVVQIIDDDAISDGVPSRWLPWVKTVINDPLPRVAFAPTEGGEIQDYPLPADYDALVALLGGGQ